MGGSPLFHADGYLQPVRAQPTAGISLDKQAAGYKMWLSCLYGTGLCISRAKINKADSQKRCIDPANHACYNISRKRHMEIRRNFCEVCACFPYLPSRYGYL